MLSRALGDRTIRGVGVGELSLSVSASRGIDRSGAERALHAALQAGFDLVDVAAEDDAERVAGEALRTLRLRDTVVLATRVPAITERTGLVVRDTLRDRLPPRYVQAQVESALRATRLDALPLVQLDLRALWRSSPAWPELVGTCDRLVREGKVLQWAAFVAQLEDDTAALVSEPWLAAISVPFSLCERAADNLLAAAAASTAPPTDAAIAATGLSSEHLRSAGISPELVIAAGLPAELVLAASADQSSSRPPPPRRELPPAILARRPLAGAALAGTLGPGVRLRPRDDRNAIDPTELERIAVGATKLARFVKHVPPAAGSCEAAKAQRERSSRPDHVECETLAELALRYVVTRGAIALPRLHRHEHVTEALAASVLPPLPTDLLEQLDI